MSKTVLNFGYLYFDIVQDLDISIYNFLVLRTSSVCLLANNFSSLSFPSRGAFHLSLAVLVHYRQILIFRLGSWSTQIPTKFIVLHGTQEQTIGVSNFAYESFTLFGRPFRIFLLSLTHRISSALQPCNKLQFSLFRFRSPLLTESHMIYFPSVTKMFQFTPCPTSRYIILANYFYNWSPIKGRLLHSETTGSKVNGTSPTNIAAVCVLPRSKSPRHPLLALIVNLKDV